MGRDIKEGLGILSGSDDRGFANTSFGLISALGLTAFGTSLVGHRHPMIARMSLIGHKKEVQKITGREYNRKN